uniref:Uncharacterized protein n=1 Tax=Anguilla anguilla TaxID=7936 RepID=A0A0E9QI45_ANGAN
MGLPMGDPCGDLVLDPTSYICLKHYIMTLLHACRLVQSYPLNFL